MSSISSSRQANPLNYNRKEYGFYGLSGNQTTGIATNSPVKFDTCLTGNIAFNPAIHTWTLKANKTYLLTAECYGTFNNDAGYIDYVFKTSGGTLLGTYGQGLPQTYASRLSESPIAKAVFTPTIDTDITLNLLVNSTYCTAINTGYTFVEIEEFENFYPMAQAYQYAYVSPPLALSVSGQAGFTLLRGYGIFTKTNDGTWWVDLDIRAKQNNNTTGDITITGVVFKTIPSVNYSYIGANSLSNSTLVNAGPTGTSGVIWIRANANMNSIVLSGKVELNAKPTGYAIPADV